MKQVALFSPMALLLTLLLVGCSDTNETDSASDANRTTDSVQSCGPSMSAFRNMTDIIQVSATWKKEENGGWSETQAIIRPDRFDLNSGAEGVPPSANCQHLHDVFGSFLADYWEVDETIIPRDAAFSYSPEVTLLFAEPAVESLAHWRALGEPEFRPAKLATSELIVRLSYNNAEHVFRDLEDVTTRLSLTCTGDTFQHQIRLQPVVRSLTTDLDNQYCEDYLNPATQETKKRCLVVGTKLPNNSLLCQFSDAHVFVPTARNTYIDAVLSGRIEQNSAEDFTLNITKMGLAN